MTVNEDAPFREPPAVLAWSERLANAAELDEPLLALWQPAGITAAIGLAQSPEKELRLGDDRAFDIGLLRRQSGGGAVLLYAGVLCWEALASVNHIDRLHGGAAGIRPAYDHLCRPVVDGLVHMGIDVFRVGVSDLSVRAGGEGEFRKVAGTAQYRHKQNVLVHGALLVDSDIDELSRYLLFPSSQPDYRQGRAHRDFCISLAEVPGVVVASGDGLMNGLAAAIARAAASRGWKVTSPPTTLDAETLGLEKAKYRNPEWNWKRIRQGTA